MRQVDGNLFAKCRTHSSQTQGMTSFTRCPARMPPFAPAPRRSPASTSSPSYPSYPLVPCRGGRGALSFYLSIPEFINAMFQIPTTTSFPNVTPSPNYPVTQSTLYAAGRAPVYDSATDLEVGACSATFLCQDTGHLSVDISNHLTIDSGLIVSWFTPAIPGHLLADSLVRGMVTEAIVTSTTKVGHNPYYGQTLNLTVSSENDRIYFDFQRRRPV